MSWYWKNDLRFKDDEAGAWTAYSDDDSKRIESAFKKNQKTFKLSDEYKIDFAALIQHRIEDRNRQRAVKRLETSSSAKKKAGQDVKQKSPKKAKKQLGKDLEKGAASSSASSASISSSLPPGYNTRCVCSPRQMHIEKYRCVTCEYHLPSCTADLRKTVDVKHYRCLECWSDIECAATRA
eukprot:TRINITY_DN3114_c0_g1_i1.p1 TRINITY_DN3114_c0_g1~~TRINITY_DN3114_c0_g1_i1.p1  ORF type:complete len:181 (-),score=7.97 TRINITY_DN3114_c0_g1_i1:60-602(-)